MSKIWDIIPSIHAEVLFQILKTYPSTFSSISYRHALQNRLIVPASATHRGRPWSELSCGWIFQAIYLRESSIQCSGLFTGFGFIYHTTSNFFPRKLYVDIERTLKGRTPLKTTPQQQNHVCIYLHIGYTPPGRCRFN